MARVFFDIDEFREIYPAFTETEVSDERLENYFHQAEYFVGNEDGKSLFTFDPPRDWTRKQALFLVTCHLATIDLWPEGQTGRIASASQGSVSTSFDLAKSSNQTAEFWNQTRCGALYWMMARRFVFGGRVYSSKKPHPFG